MAKEYFKSIKNLKKWRSGLCVLNIRQGLEFQSLLQFLLVTQSKSIELFAYENREWKVVRRASPGNTVAFEDELHGDGGGRGDGGASAAVFLAVFPLQRGGETTIGCAYVDTTLKSIGVCEFVDNEQLANFESLLVQVRGSWRNFRRATDDERISLRMRIQVGVRECCTIADDKNYLIAKLTDLLKRCEIPIVAKKRSDFKMTDVEQDTRRLVGDKRWRQCIAYLDYKAAMSALSCLVTHLELLSDATAIGSWRLKYFDLRQYMRLDAAALKALNLVPTGDDVNQKMNLATLLDVTKTAMGSRLLRQMIMQPLLDVEQIAARQDVVMAFLDDTLMRQRVRDTNLRGMCDVDRLCRKLTTNKASLQDLVTLYQFACRLPDLAESLAGHSGPHAARINAMVLNDLKVRSEHLSK